MSVKAKFSTGDVVRYSWVYAQPGDPYNGREAVVTGVDDVTPVWVTIKFADGYEACFHEQTLTPLKQYLVVSPSYSTNGGEVDPPEDTCLTWEGYAETRQAARTLAVKAWRAKWSSLPYCGSDNPFTGVRVYEEGDDNDE